MKPGFKFNEEGLLPVIVQDYNTNEVLMLAYMNEQSFKETLKTKKCVFYSRSRGKMWLKGETSGHFQIVKEIFVDCDNDAVLIKAEQKGAACHTGYYSCFYRRLDPETEKIDITGKKIFNPEDVYKEEKAKKKI